MNKPLTPYTGVVRASARFGWRVYCYGIWAHFRLLSHAMDCATDLLGQRQRADTKHQPKVAYLGEL